MTENEALKYLNHMLQMMADEPPENIKNERDIKEWEDEHRKIKETFEISKNALEEIQQYRAIGTIEDFKALKEKSVAKKPIERKRNYLTVFDCPTCNAELYSGQRFCDECGQSILDDYE